MAKMSDENYYLEDNVPNRTDYLIGSEGSAQDTKVYTVDSVGGVTGGFIPFSETIDLQNYNGLSTSARIAKKLYVYDKDATSGAVAADGKGGGFWVEIDEKTVETDPIFTASPAYGITSLDIANWDSTALTVSTKEANWDDAYTYSQVGHLPLTGGTLTGDLIVETSVQLGGGTGTQGTLSWNPDEETLDLIQNGAVLQIGQELQVHCRNNTGVTIPDGTVVMATGTLGASGRITIAPYDNTSSVKFIIGITTEDIINGDDGKVTTFGKIRGIDTSMWNEADVLYTASNGSLTNVEPSTGISNPIAFVINKHAQNGTIMVRVTPIDEHAFTLQGVYDNTDGAKIITIQDTVTGAVVIKHSATSVNNITTFEVQSDAGASNFKVTNNGVEVGVNGMVVDGTADFIGDIKLDTYKQTGLYPNLLSVDDTGQVNVRDDRSSDWTTAYGWGDWSTGVNKAFVDALGVDSDTLGGEAPAYYLAWGNLTGVPTTFPPSAHTHTTSDITNLSSYTGFDTRYYTETEIDNFFSGVTAVAGYNKANWDAAYGWGNHALAGYLTSETDPVFTSSPAYGISSADINAWDVTALTVSSKESSWDSAYNYSQVGHIPLSQKGVSNGVATLDGNGKVPLTQINDSIIGQVEYKGLWNASTNTPTLPATPTEKGHYYIVSTAGTQFGIDFEVGDWIISGDTSWSKVDNTDAVSSVFGRTGNISALESDYQSFYPRLSQFYANPSWISSLAWSKITGTPTTFPPSPHTLDSHSNVSITSNTNGEILLWNGTAWVNRTLAEAGISAVGHTHTTSDITNLSSYTGFDARYYTESQINNFFNGTTFISGYNKSNWDTAYGWGNHALAGYLTVETDPVFTGSPAYGITSGDITAWNNTALTVGIKEADWDAAYTYSQIGHLPLSGGTITGALTVDGVLQISDYLYHSNDVNTYLRFATDYAQLVAGGRNIIKLSESTDPDIIELGDSTTYTFTQGRVGVGTPTPNNMLDVNGGIDADTLNTGQGDNELYAMNQNVRTTDNVTFAIITATGGNSTNWNTAYGWGNHATAGYLTSVAFSDIQASSVLLSTESFADVDTQLMSAAAINDLILSKGYTSNVGDITGVTAGTGLSGGGTSGTVTITNSDRGSSQNIFKNVAVSGQSTIVADSNNDTLTFAAGAGIGLTTNATTDTVTVTNTITNNNQLTNGAGYITDGNTNWNNTYGFITSSSTDTLTNKSGNISQWTNDAGYTTNVGDITAVTAGTGLSGGGTSGAVTLNLDFSELTDMTGDISGTTQFILQNGSVESRKAASEIKLSNFNNDSGWTSNVGDITGVTAGGGITGGGTSGSVTVSHADTSSQSSVNNSNGNVIQDITLDTYGHITAIGSTNLDSRYYTETEINGILDGSISKSGYNKTNWDTAYGWGDWDAGVTKAYVDALNINADTLDGLQGNQFALSGFGGAISTNSDLDSNSRRNGMYRVNNGLTSAPSSSRYYSLNVFGNEANVVAQMATDWQSGETYFRAYNTSWTPWKRAWTDSDFTSTQVSNWDTAYGWGDWSVGVTKAFVDALNVDADTIDGLNSSSFMRVDANDTYSPTNFTIFANTSDGSDTKRIVLGGGGAGTNQRGAFISLNGNEYSGAGGDLSLTTGLTGTMNIKAASVNFNNTPPVDATATVALMLDGSNNLRTKTLTDTTYSAGSGLDLTGTVFSVEPDLRDGITHIGLDTTDYISFTNNARTDFFVNNVNVGRFTNGNDLLVRGDVVATSSTLTSDIKYKEDIETIESATELVSQLRGVMFTWKGNSKAGVRDMGVIAQEVEAVIPEVVHEKEDIAGDTKKTVDYAKLVALLIESNKELSERIVELDERVKKLENGCRD